MNCQQIQENISLYMDDILNEEEKQLLNHHIIECENCTNEFAYMIDLINDLQNIPQKELPFGYHEELIKKVELITTENQKKNKKEKKRLFFTEWLKPMVAVFLLVILVGTATIFSLEVLTPKNLASDSAPRENSSKADMAPSAYDGNTGQVVYDSKIAETQDITAESEETSKSQESFVDSVVLQDQKIIKKATLSLEVEEFDNTVQEIRTLVEQSGGYMEHAESYIYSSNREREEYLKEGNFVLKIPKDKYGSAQERIIQMGHLNHQNENSLNVTEQYIDTESRIRMLNLQEERLLKIMEQATKVEDLILLEQRLNEVRSEIEVFQSKIKNWDKLVSFSTIEIHLRQVKKVMIEPVQSEFGVKLKEGVIDSINNTQRGLERLSLHIARNFMQIVFRVILLLIGIWLAKFLYKKVKLKKRRI
ncbi:MAG: DUF4349 domain-containing protein [Epulopiscium sp.]|nr:DUF4349 domain-containing protein [Candidatus Epulonipiscium sp.]